MYKVALISLHDIGTYGHRCLSSALKKNGFDVSNIFFRSNSVYQEAKPVSNTELQTLCSLIMKINPAIIGINIHSSFGHILAETIIGKIKLITDAPIIMGGVHPTILPEYCMKNSKTDYICVGEGEESMIELCKSLQKNIKTNIPGIISRKYPEFTPRVILKSLDEFPHQDFGDNGMFSINIDGKIIEGDPLLKSDYYFTKASRGCPFHCSFCTVSTLRNITGSKKFCRLRSVDNVIEELSEFISLNKNCKNIRFWDDTFPYNGGWVREFSEKYKQRINLPFDIWLNPDTTNEENIALLKISGLRRATIGIESASEETRTKIFLRTESKTDIINADNILSKHRVEKVYDLILDHPWESQTEFQETFSFAQSIIRPYKLNMHSLILFPCTNLSQRAINENISSEQDILSNVINDPDSNLLKMQWVKEIPTQQSKKRNFWIFLIYSTFNPLIPRNILNNIANSPLLNKHPEVFSLNKGISEWIEEEKIPSFIRSFYKKSRFLQFLFANKPIVKKKLKDLILRIKPISIQIYWLAYIIICIAIKLPVIIVSSKFSYSKA